MTDEERQDLAEKCDRIDKAGGSVREYLHSIGFISPWGTWFRLQKEELCRKECQITNGKGSMEMRKLTLEQKKAAVEIALRGGDPLVYLRNLGSDRADGLWYAIKQNLKEVDPEAYAKLPDLRKKNTATAEQSTGDAEEISVEELAEMAPVIDQDQTEEKEMDARQVAEKIAEEIAEKNAMIVIGKNFQVTALKTEYGEFRVDNGMMHFRSDSKDIVWMPVGDWQKLAVDLPNILEIFGLDKN